MPSSVESQILARAAMLVQDLTALIRQSALDTVQDALAGQRVPTSRGRTARTAAPAATRSAGRRPKGAKRDPADIQELTDKLATFIKKTPGQRIEQIGKALGIATKELALPVKKLIAAKSISTKGQKRATTYFPR